MSTNNYGYGDSYPYNSRQQTSQSGQQSFSTPNATSSGSCFGLQATASATATRGFTNSDYQSQQYPQQRSANDASNVNWYYPNRAGIAASSDGLPNINISEQQSSSASKAPSQQSYDTTGLGNLAYSPALNYGSTTDTSQAPTTTDYSSATTYGGRSRNNGQTQAHQRTSSQNYDQNRQATDNARSFQSNTIVSTQRCDPPEVPRAPTTTLYNLPNPSPTYPQSLINAYPASATSAANPRALALPTSRNSDVSEESQSQINVQQASYTNQYSYPQAQPQAQASSRPPSRTQPKSQVSRSGRISPEQMRKTQTPTPPAPSLRRVPPVNPNAKYQGHLTQSQPASSAKSHAQQNQTIQNQGSRTRAKPAPSMSPSSMPVNIIRTTNAPTPLQSQTTGVQYSSRSPAISEPQRIPPPTYLPLALQRSAGYQNQQQPAAQLREPSPDRPTTVDPSHVYNPYHEYHKQIEAAEAEKARLAALKAAQDAADAAEAEKAAVTLQQTSMADSNVEESESDEDEEVNQQIAMEARQRAGSHGTPAVTKPSKTNVGTAETSDLASNAKDPSAAAMEEEMRMMVEKLREYQTKDPKLFLQVWSSVKKTTQSPQVDANHGQSSAPGSGLGGALATPSPTIQLNQGIPTAGHGGAAASAIYEAQDSASDSPPSNPNPKKRGSRAKAAIAERRAAKVSKRAAKEDAREEEKGAKAVALAEVGQTQFRAPYSSIHQQASRSRAPSQPPAPKGNIEVVYHANSLMSANRPAPKSVGKSPPAPILPLSATGSMATPAIAQSKNPSVNPNNTPKTSSNKGGLWPDEQRDLIAFTSANVLNALAENKGKIMRVQQIRQMLEDNPSYVELCEKIEKLGFTMDRARFAKTLLGVIQGNLKTPQPGPSGGSQVPSSTGGTNLVQQPTGNSQSPAVAASASSSRPAETRNLPPGSPSSSRSAPATTSPATGSGIKRGRGRPRKNDQRKAENQQSDIAPQTSAIHSESQGAVSSVNAEVTYPNDEAERSATSTVPYKPPIWSRDGPATSSSPPGPPIQYNSDYASPYTPGSSMPAGPSHTPQMVSTPSTVNPKQKRRPSTMKHQPPVNGQFAGIQQIYQSIYQQDGRQHAQQGRTDTAIGGQPGAFHNEVGAAQMQSKPGTSLIFAYHSATIPPNTQPEISPKPVTKEMAARKRTFAEILGLTKDLAESDEDEDDEPEAKMRRVGDRNNDYPDISLRVPAPLQQVNATASLQPPTLITASHPFAAIKTGVSTPTSLEVTPNPLRDFDGIILPIDRNSALRKSRYNPKTIARDVLIATSRHPSQRGLNAHLEGLKKRFTKVDDTSDLGTFRWDIVDPGGLPVGSANMDAEPEKTGDNDRSSFQIQQQHSPSHLRDPILPGGSYALSSRGPGHPPMHDPTPSKPSSLRNESNLNSGFSVVIDLTQPTQPRRPGRPPKDPNAPSKVKVPGRGPGRPPKDPNALPKVHTPGRLPGRPRKIVDPDEFPPSGNKAGSPSLDEYGNIIKRRPGRPAKTPSSAPSTSSKRMRLGSPKFIPFLCEWKNCKAELQNLETLRSHIHTVHGKIIGPRGISCHWAKCGSSDIEPKLYPTAQGFKDHVEAVHLVPYSWHMGDGPRGSTLDGSTPPSTPPYLFSNGTQITPSINNQKIETGNPVANNARRLAEAAATRPQSVWEYMFGKDVMLNPALRVGSYPFDERIEYEDPLLGLREYDDELREAAWEAERTGEEPRAVFGRV